MLSIEQALTELTAAVRDLTAALQIAPATEAQPAPWEPEPEPEKEPAKAKTPAKAKAPAKAPEPEVPPEHMDEAETITLADVRAALAALGLDKARPLLAKYGATRLPELAPSEYPAVLAEARKGAA